MIGVALTPVTEQAAHLAPGEWRSAHGTSERSSRFSRTMDVRYLKTFVAPADVRIES